MDQVNIPGAETSDEFKCRVEAVLGEWLEMHDVNLLIAVCTRSTLIMLVNLIQLADDFSYEGYKAYDFDVSSLTRVDVLDTHPQVITMNQVGHLTGDISG